jgi:hypothetical protein
VEEVHEVPAGGTFVNPAASQEVEAVQKVPSFYFRVGNHFSPANESKISARALVSASNSFETRSLGTSPKAEKPVAFACSGFFALG